MIKDGVHGDLLVQAAVEVGLPVVVGLTLDVLHKSSDQEKVVLRDDPNLTVTDMIAYWGSHTNVVGFSAMHCSVKDTEIFVKEIRTSWDGFVGAYPNQGIWKPPDWCVEQSLTAQEYGAYASLWYAAGANAIGGCCGLGPEHIAAVKQVANEIKNKLNATGSVNSASAGGGGPERFDTESKISSKFLKNGVDAVEEWVGQRKLRLSQQQQLRTSTTFMYHGKKYYS